MVKLTGAAEYGSARSREPTAASVCSSGLMTAVG